MKYKIIHIVRNPHTGVARIVDELIKQQIKDGYDSSILVIASNEWKKYDWMTVENEDIIRVSKDISGTVIFLMHLFGYKKNAIKKEIKRKIGDDMVILHYHNAWLSCAFMGLKSSKNIKQIVTYHGLASEHALLKQPIRRWIHSMLARITNRLSDAVITVDPTTPDRAKKLFGTKISDYHFIANGAPGPKITLELEKNICHTNLTVGHLGTIDYGKGWKITADAVDLCNANGMNVGYIIAGVGEEQDFATNYANIKSEYVTYLGWVNDVDKEFFNRIDLLVMPSNSEGMPVAAIEAMANAIPVIATNVGGLPALIGDNIAGVIVKRDPCEISNIIANYSKNHTALMKLKRSAFERWKNFFSVAIMSKNYNAIYEKSFGAD